MKILLRLFFLASLAFCANGQLTAPQAPGLDSALLKLFGDIKAFSTTADMRMLDKDQKEITRFPMTMALLDEKFRAEVDLSQMKSTGMPPEAAGMFKKMGMERVVTIMSSGGENMLVIYPALKTYVEMPVPKEGAVDKNTKVERTVEGKETIDDIACEKNRVVTTNSKGEKQEALVWTAPAWKNFPVQMRLQQEQNTVLIRYQKPNFQKPNPDQFVAPAGFTKEATLEKLMQKALVKMMNEAK